MEVEGLRTMRSQAAEESGGRAVSTATDSVCWAKVEPMLSAISHISASLRPNWVV